MAKQQKLMKAFEAFINHDTDTAKEQFRQHFIESAQRIISRLEEDFGGDMEEDLYDETEVDMEDGIDDDPFAEEDSEGEFEEYNEEDLDGAEATGEPVEISADAWANFEDAVDEMFGSAAPEDELDFGDDEIDADMDADMDVDPFAEEDELDELDESFDYSKVKDPGMTSETGVDSGVKSPVAKNAKSPTGVKATDGWSKDGSVKGSNVKAEYPDAATAKVTDHSNVLKSGKKVYSKASTPNAKETGADKSAKSPTRKYKK